MKNEIQYKDITYPKLVELHKLGLLSKVESIDVYPAQIEFKFDKRLDENHRMILNDWFINFFINLSNEIMEIPCMTSCSMNFFISENNDLLCQVDAVISSGSDLFVGSNELNHDEDDDEEEEWVETISMKSYFQNGD